jgi:hypothetical protein
MMARAELARLVRSLIVQTNDQVVLLEMRAGEGSQVAGYDGIVQATRGTPFVPEGRSVWELGTGGDPAAKASSDYRNRTKNPLGESQSEATFVFITPRSWPKKQAWIARRKKAGCPWKDIWVIDVDGIEAALEQAVGLHFVFSEQLGKPALGVTGIEEWWQRFSTISNPALSPEMVLSGRRDDASAFLRLLEEDVRTTSINAASTDDVLTFVAAAILSAAEDRRLDLMARTLIVRDAHSLRMLDVGAKLLILLPYEEELLREALLIRAHHVVLLAPRDHPADITLSALDQGEFTRLLRSAGVGDSRATDLARAAGRSIVAFQGQAAPRGARIRPQWMAWFESRTLRRAWLAGAWSQLRSGDVEAMTDLLGQPFDDVEGEIRSAAGGDDPLFTVVGQVWAVASPEATWDFCRTRLTRGDLGQLERMVQTVLGAIDPALALPIEERWMASVHGKSRVHSTNLRSGLATTLAVLGSLGESVNLGGGVTARSWSERMVGQLLVRANEDSTGHFWTSLTDVLPLLAEAAPEQFLREVQKGAMGTGAVLAKLFTDDKGALTTSSAHPGLLWALEVVAWSPQHLALTAEALARLVELDPDGQLSNRPLNSLLGVFRPWMPQTSATPEARLAVLESLIERHGEVGWSLLLGLLPEVRGFAVPASAPRFRSWAREVAEVPVEEYWQVVDGVIAQLLKLVETDPDRWPALIARLPDMPATQRNLIYDRLEMTVPDE